MSTQNKTSEITLSSTFERFAKFVGTVIRYIELAIVLAVIGTLFLIVSILEALF
jgi:hypothetical protein